MDIIFESGMCLTRDLHTEGVVEQVHLRALMQQVNPSHPRYKLKGDYEAVRQQINRHMQRLGYSRAECLQVVGRALTAMAQAKDDAKRQGDFVGYGEIFSIFISHACEVPDDLLAKVYRVSVYKVRKWSYWGICIFLGFLVEEINREKIAHAAEKKRPLGTDGRAA